MEETLSVIETANGRVLTESKRGTLMSKPDNTRYNQWHYCKAPLEQSQGRQPGPELERVSLEEPSSLIKR